MERNKEEKKLTTKARKAHEEELKPRNQVPLCSFVRLRGLYSSSLIRSFSVINLLAACCTTAGAVSPAFSG
jgi:hypothetical protein